MSFNCISDSELGCLVSDLKAEGVDITVSSTKNGVDDLHALSCTGAGGGNCGGNCGGGSGIRQDINL